MKTPIYEIPDQHLNVIIQALAAQPWNVVNPTMVLMQTLANSEENKARRMEPETNVREAVAQAMARRQPRPPNPEQGNGVDASALGTMVMGALSAVAAANSEKKDG